MKYKSLMIMCLMLVICAGFFCAGCGLSQENAGNASGEAETSDTAVLPQADISAAALDEVYGVQCTDMNFYGDISDVPETVWFKMEGWIADFHEDLDNDGENEQLVFYLERPESLNSEASSQVGVDVYRNGTLLDSLIFIPPVDDIINEVKMLDFTVDMNIAEDGRKVVCYTVYYNSDVTVDAYGDEFPEDYRRANVSDYYILEDDQLQLGVSVASEGGIYKFCEDHSLWLEPEYMESAVYVPASGENTWFDSSEQIEAYNTYVNPYGGRITEQEEGGVTYATVNYKYLLGGSKARYEAEYEVYIELLVFDSFVPIYDETSDDNI